MFPHRSQRLLNRRREIFRRRNFGFLFFFAITFRVEQTVTYDVMLNGGDRALDVCSRAAALSKQTQWERITCELIL